MKLLHYISARRGDGAEYVIICEDGEADVDANKKPGYKFVGSHDIQHASGQDILPVGRELMAD